MAGEPMRNGFDPETQYAALGERVDGQGRRLTNLEQTVTQGFRQVESSIAGLSTEFRNNQRPQWQALSVMLAAALAIGALAYWPIREATNDLKATVSALAVETNQSIRILGDKAVTRAEMDWRGARGAEDRERTEADLKDLRTTMLPRNEWNEKNQSRDHDIDNIREIQTRDSVNTQRQLDLLRADFQTFAASLGNGRDFIDDLKSEQNRLRDQISELRMLLASRNTGTRFRTSP